MCIPISLLTELICPHRISCMADVIENNLGYYPKTYPNLNLGRTREKLVRKTSKCLHHLSFTRKWANIHYYMYIFIISIFIIDMYCRIINFRMLANDPSIIITISLILL